MNIAIEARALTTQGAGVKTYTQELLRHLIKYKDKADFTVVYASKQTSALADLGYHVVSVPLKNEWQILTNSWLTKDVQQALAPLRPNLVHYTKAAIPTTSVYPAIVSIHDVIPLLLPQSQSLGARYYWPGALRQAAKKSTHIITISEASKRDIIKYLRVEPDKITVTPLAVNLELFKPAPKVAVSAALQVLNISAPYILFLATRDMRKNIATLLRAFAGMADDFPHTLVIAGKNALRHDKSEQLSAKLGLQKRVKWLDFVPFEHVPALYSGADLFVWPSVYEGWGMPVLEAMACGVPVIVSDGGALPEVAGQAAVVVPFSTDDLIDRFSDKEFQRLLTHQMRAVLGDDAKRTAMREAGLRQAESFSWHRVADTTWEVYKKFAV